MLRLGTIVPAYLVQGFQRIRQHQLWTYNLSVSHLRSQSQRTSREGHAGNTVAQNHWNADCHVFPSSQVITSPNSAESLRACKECTREYKWSHWLFGTVFDSLSGGILLHVGQNQISFLPFKIKMELYEEHAVDVVDITMFPSAIVDVGLGHSDFWSVENRRLRNS
jgi:hypothetical protein